MRFTKEHCKMENNLMQMKIGIIHLSLLLGKDKSLRDGMRVSLAWEKGKKLLWFAHRSMLMALEDLLLEFLPTRLWTSKLSS